MAGTKGENGKFIRVPVAERFWDKVDQSGGPDACWEWQGTRLPAGYGQTADFWKKYLTHRLAFELTNGPIPAGKNICHRCDNPPCCNPTHLYAGSQGDNLREAYAKGRKVVQTKSRRRGTSSIQSKLTDDEVRAIRTAYATRATKTRRGVTSGTTAPGSIRGLAAHYGVSPTLIHKIVTREAWPHL